MDENLYGGVELGGTKTICVVGNDDGELVASATLATTRPQENVAAIAKFFAEQPIIKALGVGTFGPVHLDKSSSNYGTIGETPKAGWQHVPLKTLLSEQMQVPVAIDTDVDCAALGEQYSGAAQDASNFVYLSFGTGVGGSIVYDKHLEHGRSHLEIGHMRIPHEPFAEDYHGSCPYHGDCLEGIASGQAMRERYGQPAEDITDASVWQRQASYMATAITNIILILAPEKIVLGGGLLNHTSLLAQTRSLVAELVNNYVELPDIANYIVASSGATNGACGAIKLAALSAYS
jgi:fructokinase